MITYTKSNDTWFTIVELIVVITILAILWTIWFISFSSHLAWTRDTNRISQIIAIHDWLDVYRMRNKLPLPDNYVELRSSWTLIWYQWYAWKNILEQIQYVKWWLDPKDNQYYTYYTTSDKKHFQLMAYLEDEGNIDISLNFINNAYAIDLSKRYPTLYWNKLWILTESWSNIPIQDVQNVVSSWYLDISTTNSYYKVYFSDSEYVSWTWKVLYKANPRSSCERLLQSGLINSNWEYYINPNWEKLPIYCSTQFITQNFYDFIEDWDMENSSSSNWPLNTVLLKTTEDKNSWLTSLKSIWNTTIKSNNFTYVESWKKYKLSWYFKSIWPLKSRLYFGFAEYDKDFNFIQNHYVNAVAWTETTLATNVSSTDSKIDFNCDDTIFYNWSPKPSPNSNLWLLRHSYVAFEIDDSWNFDDLPNKNLSRSISNSSNTNVSTLLTKNWNICTITFHPTVWNKAWVNYPAWTKIRLHNSWGNYNYIAASNPEVPYSWNLYSWEVFWISKYWADPKYFRRWTKFVKILMLTNHSQTTNEVLLIDDLKLSKID